MSDEFFSGVDKAVEALSLGSGSARIDELMRLSRELMSALDVEQALLAAGEAVRQVCEAERFVVLLAEDALVARAARDAAGVDLPLPPAVPAEPLTLARESGELVYAYLPSQHARFSAWKSVETLSGFMAVPMMAADRCVGVIYADGVSRFNAKLDESVQEVIMLLAGHAALAVSNAQLLARVRAGAPGQLGTRVQFEHHLNEELLRAARYARPFSVVYVDIVGADQLLDRYDLDALDELVAGVSQAVGRACRSSDIIARVGPARIGLVLPEPTDGLGDLHGLRALSVRLREQLAIAQIQVRRIPQRVEVLLGAVSYQQAPLLGLRGILHEVDLAADVAGRSRADHFIAR